VSGLLALLLGLTGAVYAAWPWLWGRARPLLSDERDAGVGDDMENIERALREWSVSAGEVGIGASSTIEGASRAEMSRE